MLTFKDLYNYKKNCKSLENYKSYTEFLDNTYLKTYIENLY